MKNFILPLLLLAACFTTGCDKADVRVARWNVNVTSDAEGKTRLATVRKGERVELLQAGEERSQIRLADGATAYVESKYLFLESGVLAGAGARLYNRPSASSGEAPSQKNVRSAAVFFVKSRETNEEGEWLEVEGGQGAAYFRGWLKADAPAQSGVEIVALALRLEAAIQKKDEAELEALAGEAPPIGEAAAAALTEIRGPLEPEDSAAVEESVVPAPEIPAPQPGAAGGPAK